MPGVLKRVKDALASSKEREDREERRRRRVQDTAEKRAARLEAEARRHSNPSGLGGGAGGGNLGGP